MKYAIVIPDGCADEPQDALGGKTPLQAARLPNMDRAVRMGLVGRSNNVPAPLTPASDVATLELVWLRSAEAVYTGRAPLETVAMGHQTRPARLGDSLQPGDGDRRQDARLHGRAHQQRRWRPAHGHDCRKELGGPIPGGRLEFHPGVSIATCLLFATRKPAGPIRGRDENSAAARHSR